MLINKPFLSLLFNDTQFIVLFEFTFLNVTIYSIMFLLLNYIVL